MSGRDRDRRARALDLAERALEAIEPGAATQRAIERLGPLDGATLFAFGKAAIPMACAAARSVALAGGVVVAPRVGSRGSASETGSPQPFVHVHVHEDEDVHEEGLGALDVRWGSHPDPADDAVETGRAVLARASALGAGDAALCLVSGGGSALLELPAGTITLAELVRVTRELREGGASIDELNAVRRVLSRLKGGGLAAAMAPARIRNVIVSDVAPHSPSLVASGPTCPPPDDAPDPQAVLERYAIPLPDSVRAQLAVRSPAPTLDVCTEVAADVFTALAAMRAMEPSLRDREGTFAGEARELGARIAAERGEGGWVWGGETTVALTGDGVGGRNQEVALGALAAGWSRGLLLCFGTDGIDGASDAAGALIDGAAQNEMRRRGLDPAAALAANDATPFFDAIGTTLRCGPTGTNVADVAIYLP